MAFTGSAVPAAQLSAQADDAPFVIADNHVRDVLPFWSSDGTGTGSDVTDPSAPASRATDGQQHFGTTNTSGSATVHRFVWQFAGSVAFDTLYLKLIGSNVPSSVVFQIADDAAFSTNLVTLFTFTPPGGSARYLGANNTRYTGTGWCRVVINFSPGAAAPQIAEVVLGQRRQLSRRPDQGSGYDDQPHGSTIDAWETRGGVRQNYLHARGFSNYRGMFTPTGADAYGLDDLTMLRAVVTDSDYLKEPIVWVDRPNSALDFACFGDLEFSGLDAGLEAPFQGYAKRQVPFRFHERPSFARRDNRTAVP